MRENDEITGLFRSRLAGAEMTVREGFWEKLQEDVASPAASRKKAAFLSPKYYRIAAAASVIFVLGGVSAAFWFFSPKEEIKDAFTQVAALTPEGSLNGDVALIGFIVLSILVVIAESIQGWSAVIGPYLRFSEYVFTFFFTVEYLLRLYCSPRPRKYEM